MNMLSNERYCGDAILQKSVTIDCIEKKRKKNTGEAPMYYVQNNHPAIIDRVTFNKVQEELARRKTKTPGSAKSSITSTGKYSRYALTDVLICGNCGTRYRRVTWSRNGVKRIVWRCISRLDYGKKYCSDSPTIMEDKLQEAIVRAVNKFNEQDSATYKALMRATISEALGLNGDPEEVDNVSFAQLEDTMLKAFAWYLYLNKDKKIVLTINGTELDYRKYINTDASVEKDSFY